MLDWGQEQERLMGKRLDHNNRKGAQTELEIPFEGVAPSNKSHRPPIRFKKKWGYYKAREETSREKKNKKLWESLYPPREGKYNV